AEDGWGLLRFDAGGNARDPSRLLPGRPLGRAGGGAGDRLQRSGDDVAVHADAVECAGAAIGATVRDPICAGAADLDIGGGLRVGARADRVIVLIEARQRDAVFALQRIDKGGDRSVADALDLAPGHSTGAIDLDRRGDATLAGARLRQEAVIDELDAVAAEIGVLEQGPDHLAGDFLAGAVGDLLHDAAELDLQPARQIEPVI